MPWKLLIVGIAIFFLYKLITNDRGGPKKKSDAKAKERKIASGELVKDPVCGAYVDAESAISVRDGKTVHRFCSYECRKQFLDELEDQGREIPKLEKSQDDD